ncbi:MAG: toll/interleukin-1 receptor domain-containing protein [Chloroflexota bacterium]
MAIRSKLAPEQGDPTALAIKDQYQSSFRSSIEALAGAQGRLEPYGFSLYSESAITTEVLDLNSEMDSVVTTSLSTAEPDVFISYASEDRLAIAQPLAEALQAQGLVVWYDRFVLTLGDSLREKIDDGLAKCRFGIVILSPRFFAKSWPRRELNGLADREVAGGSKVLLPVWHDIDHDGVASHSPPLADKLAVSTTDGLDQVVQQILEVVRPNSGPASVAPSAVTTQPMLTEPDRSSPAPFDVTAGPSADLHVESVEVLETGDEPGQRPVLRIRVTNVGELTAVAVLWHLQHPQIWFDRCGPVGSDPNPEWNNRRWSGRGSALLIKAGATVDIGVLAREWSNTPPHARALLTLEYASPPGQLWQTNALVYVGGQTWPFSWDRLQFGVDHERQSGRERLDHRRIHEDRLRPDDELLHGPP